MAFNPLLVGPQLKVQPEYHYGDKQCPWSRPEHVPADEELLFEIELLDYMDVKVSSLSLWSKLTQPWLNDGCCLCEAKSGVRWPGLGRVVISADAFSADEETEITWGPLSGVSIFCTILCLFEWKLRAGVD